MARSAKQLVERHALVGARFGVQPEHTFADAVADDLVGAARDAHAGGAEPEALDERRAFASSAAASTPRGPRRSIASRV